MSRVRVSKRSIVLLLTMCAWGVPARTSAQAVDPRALARAHVGPFYYKPGVAIEELGIDGNVFNSTDPKSDFTVTLSPRVDVWVPAGRRGLVSTALASDLVYYQTYASERSVNPDVKVRGDLFLARVTPFVEASFLSTRQRPNFEIDVRSRRQQRGGRVGVNVRLSPRLSVETVGRSEGLDYGSDSRFNDLNLQETLNRTTRALSVTVRHELTPLTTVVLKAERGAERFQFSPLRDSDTLRVVPGFEFKPRALIAGAGYIGFARFTPRTPVLEAFSGVVANASLGYTLLGSTRFIFTAERDLAYSSERVQPYFVVNGYGVMLRRQVVGRTDVTLGAQRYRYSYRNLLLAGSSNDDLDREDVTRMWSASFGYRASRDLRVGLALIRQWRETNSKRFWDYSTNRITTVLDYTF